ARQEFEAAEEVRAMADLMARPGSRVTVDEVRAKLSGEGPEQIARGKGITIQSHFWRADVIRQTEGPKSPVTEVTLFPKPPLRLTLQDLATLGAWTVIRESKTSTVRFEYSQPGGARAVVYVELKFPPKDPRSPVVWVRLRPDSNKVQGR